MRRLVEGVWLGTGGASRAVRAALWPLERAYGASMALRARWYDAGVLAREDPVVPAISVGNLTVGGTGKTPVAAWVAQRLSARARPAIVLRGYGGDEPAVHRRLNPGVDVIVNPRRADAVRAARDRGADIVVLDDAFQHRRLRRDVDLVLVGVEQLRRPRHLLPAGPWREPLSAARRAHAVILTRKTASRDDAEAAARELARVAPGVPLAGVYLAPAALVEASSGETLATERLRDAPVLAIAAVGEPGLFARQLEERGARVSLAAFRDHHAFTDEDILRLRRRAPADGLVVCTLKDAVKLAGRWPGPGRLWYVSQQLVVETGAAILDGLLERALEARAPAATEAG